jgi:uncharacterized protein with ParB-like and HNH nuclease domain
MGGRSVELVPVSQLLTRSFYIPAYQRGYRWTQDQVEDLLNDVHDFFPREVTGSKDKTWYCLQPLVVRPINLTEIDADDLSSNQIEYELIDGQQRATTIFLIGHYINEMFRGKLKEPELSLRYETRPLSSGFLKNLSVDLDDNVKIDRTNIDFFHISEAYQTIHKWVSKLSEGGCFKQDRFIDVFLNHLKVIWYQSDEADSIAIFTRINIGKIPLTNAELIKALFLKDSNFSELAKNVDIHLKQLEIANDWDRMESALHNPEFWYFLNDSVYQPETRIDLLFWLIIDGSEENLGYSVFRKFNEGFRADSLAAIEASWEEVKRCFRTLEEWYNDKERYHKIGFLVEAGESLYGLMNTSKKMRKSEFLSCLDEKIRSKLPDQLDQMDYKNKKVKLVLLLHNILTVLNNSEEKSKFPFDRYKSNGGWDVEHIHSIKDVTPDDDKSKRAWLSDALEYIQDIGLKKEIEVGLSNSVLDDDLFKDLFSRVVDHLSGPGDLGDKNELSNLALLDAATNRSYKNAVFPVKRKVIIQREKSGTFVPICTKNVFMKLYSENVSDITSWSPADRENYLSDLEEVLSPYLTIEKEAGLYG